MSELYQCVMEFTLPPGDSAQTSVWWLVGDSGTPFDVAVEFTDTFLADVWPSSSGGIKDKFPTGVVLNRLLVRQVNVSNGDTIAVSENLLGRNGTGSGSALPPEVSPCLSLRTSNPLGSGRGRCYLPPTVTGTLTATGQLANEHATDLAEGWRDGIDALNANTTFTTSTVGVYSRKLHAVQAITAVRCGTTFDSQRRRRNAVGEAYVTALVGL